jgi:hypothetical protein
MTFQNLENLEKIGKLKKETVSQAEFDGLVKSGRARLVDAGTPILALESRFDLAYNASHALALCHERRNVAEYQGHLDIEERLVADLIRVTTMLLEKALKLGKVR